MPNTQPNDGGPAFPRPSSPGDGSYSAAPQGGMSLRDYFAGQALGVIPGDVEDPDALARDAYRIADAMLAERYKHK